MAGGHGGKRPNSGRKKGSPNKKSLSATKFFDDLGLNPLEKLAEIADETEDKQLKASCYKELAQYYAPKRKAVEISGNEDKPLNHVHEIKFNITKPK